LRHLLGDEGHLKRVRMFGRAEPGEGCHLGPGRRRYRQRARPRRRAVDMNGAGPALREPAAEMRVAEPELVGQRVKQRCIRGHLDGSRLLVQLKGDALCHLEPLDDIGMSRSVE
jgi:hypothetical protein